MKRNIVLAVLLMGAGVATSKAGVAFDVQFDNGRTAVRGGYNSGDYGRSSGYVYAQPSYGTVYSTTPRRETTVYTAPVAPPCETPVYTAPVAPRCETQVISRYPAVTTYAQPYYEYRGSEHRELHADLKAEHRDLHGDIRAQHEAAHRMLKNQRAAGVPHSVRKSEHYAIHDALKAEHQVGHGDLHEEHAEGHYALRW